MIVMKRVNRIISLIAVFCLTFCSFIILGSQKPEAVSGKTMYVMTKLVMKVDDPDNNEKMDVTYSCSYDKKGLLKTSTIKSGNGMYKIKSTFKYGKGSRIKSCKTKDAVNGKYSGDSTSRKYAVNSKGFVTKIKAYNEKGKSNGWIKYSWNKKGFLTRSKSYYPNGKLSETIKYTLNSDGSIREENHYNASGKLDERIVYQTSGNVQTITDYDKNGKVESKVIATLKNGRVITMKEYNANGTLTGNAKFTYKKVKTTKKNQVKSQQRLIRNLELL